MSDAVKGTFVGMFLGATGGLGVCTWILEEPLFFTGDTMLIGGVLGTVAGVIWGEDFFEFVKEYWYSWW
jgi:hypothetical protein